MDTILTKERYLEALRQHDWHYEYTENHLVWRVGTRQHKELLQAQPEFDPDWRLWNSIAPLEYQHKVESAK